MFTQESQSKVQKCVQNSSPHVCAFKVWFEFLSLSIAAIIHVCKPLEKVQCQDIVFIFLIYKK